MRTEERRQRRNLMQKSQNLPVHKSHHSSSRSSSASFYHPVQRSTSHPHDYRYGVLRTPHLPANMPVLIDNRLESIRPSRPISRYPSNRDDIPSITPAVPIRLPTTAVRSNSSDKILDLRRTPQPTATTYSGYVSDDYSVKRSLSADLVQETPIPPRPPVQPRRQIPIPAYEYDRSNDQTFPSSNALKLNSYFSQMPSSGVDAAPKPLASNLSASRATVEIDTPDSEHVYAVRNPVTSRQGADFTQSSSNPSNNEYYFRDANIGYLSDENASTPPPVSIPRRNTDRSRYHRTELVVETDDDYEPQAQIWARSNPRSHSNEGVTEKKRVRFADMEGLTLETAPDDEQRRSAAENRFLTGRAPIEPLHDFRRGIQPFRNSFYQTQTRIGGSNESKLATDVWCFSSVLFVSVCTCCFRVNRYFPNNQNEEIFIYLDRTHIYPSDK